MLTLWLVVIHSWPRWISTRAVYGADLPSPYSGPQVLFMVTPSSSARIAMAASYLSFKKRSLFENPGL